MTIQFSQTEIELIRNFFRKIESGGAQKSVLDLPEWNTVFLLLRKLLAYGVYYVDQTDQEISYEELQAKTQKPNDMLAGLQAHLDLFENLVATYTARH
jgi:hypothetical protein